MWDTPQLVGAMLLATYSQAATMMLMTQSGFKVSGWRRRRAATTLSLSQEQGVTVLQCPSSGIFARVGPAYTGRYSVACRAFCENRTDHEKVA